MTKRFFSLMLALCMVGSIIVTVHVSAEATNSGTCGENLTWMLGDGTLTISGSGDMYDYIYPDMPWYSSLSDINNVIIGNGVTSIGDYAFTNANLTAVTIPNSVTSIGDGAFYYCNNLTTVTIPDSVTSIGSYVFYYCQSLTTVIIPDGVTEIGDYAFYYCESLTNITIPDSVTKIGKSTFECCSSLISMIIPDSITSIGENAFNACSSLTAVKIPDSVTSIKDGTFAGCTSLIAVAIPNSVTNIEDYAFNACRSLESVAIADSVKNIGDYAFYLCNKLSDVYYIGTTEEWDKIVIEGHNTPLTVANIHYNYLPTSEIVYNTESNTIELSPFNVISGKVIVATYNGNILSDISIYEAEHKINGITIDKTNATTAKIFWLDSLKKLDPKCDALERSL